MMVSHEPRMHRQNARDGRDLERPPPARYLVRRSHSSQNLQYFSYPRASDPLGSKRSVYACLRQGGGGVSRAISIALHPREKREDTRERSDGPVFLCFFSSCIVVVPEGTSPRRRPRSRAIACVRAIRERVRDEAILSAERDALGARGALGAPTRVRFFVTRARRDPSTSSRPPRSDARVVSEIRGQIFVFLLFLLFPSIVFDRPRAPPVDEGTPRRLFLIFSSYSYYFPAVARARGLFDRGRGFDTSPASRHLPWGKRRFVTRPCIRLCIRLRARVRFEERWTDAFDDAAAETDVAVVEHERLSRSDGALGMKKIYDERRRRRRRRLSRSIRR